MPSQLINFLQQELSIPDEDLALALKHSEGELHQLPMILWQYGLITLEQLDFLFDWLSTASY